MANNPRRANGYKRSQLIARLRAMRLPCALCGLPIDYELTTWTDPRDGKVKPHPYRFEVDEVVPVSRGGDPLAWDNLQPAHRICNQRRGNKSMARYRAEQARRKCSQEATESAVLPVHDEIRTSRRW